MRRCVRDGVFLLVLVIGLSIRTFVQLREGNDEWRRTKRKGMRANARARSPVNTDELRRM